MTNVFIYLKKVKIMYIIFWMILFSGIIKAVDLTEKANKICRAYGYKVLEARFGKEVHILCLKLHRIGSSLTSNQTKLFLGPDANNELVAHDFQLAELTMAYGYPIDNPTGGSAEGYIGDDQHFHGVLHLGNRTLHADPYGTDDMKKFFGVLDDDHMAVPIRDRRDNIQYSASFEQAYFPFHIAVKHQPGVARARICDLLLLADKDFYEKDANSSLTQVVQRMLHAVAQADIIFRNADFNEDGVPDNIGFSVKYILVLTSAETNARVFGDLADQPLVDGRSYLMRFARLRRLSEVCLGVAFSGHAFYNRTLGLSFTSLGGGVGGAAGGLCDRRAFGRSFNTLALAHAADRERVPERVAAITLAHEIGHSFGAHHDDNFPNPSCKGYIMNSQSPAIESSRNFQFSLCSKRLIAATLSSMSYCLIDYDRPFCGNGIVEDGEACDCGLPSRCSELDPCCTPRAGGLHISEEGAFHREGCSVAPTAQCHPSQGLCCTAECRYANLTAYGIDCTKQGQECTCTNANECRASECGLGGRCLPDGSCHAAECALLGLRECSCQSLRMGGSLKNRNMCGVCCLYQREEDRHATCLDVDLIASDLMANSGLPHNWPDENYNGPNVTVDLCTSTRCRRVVLRAWPVGEPCVSLDAVGVCSRAACQLLRELPASNIFPDLNVKRLKLAANSSGHTKYVAINFLVFILLIKCW